MREESYADNSLGELNQAPSIRNSKSANPNKNNDCGWIGKSCLIIGGLGLLASVVMNGLQSKWLSTEKSNNSQLSSQINFYNSCSQMYPTGYSVLSSSCSSYSTPCSSLYGANCLQCNNSQCLGCNSGGLYLTSNKQSCQPCPNVIPGCNSCYTSSSQTLCSSCNNNNYPSSSGISCQPCSTVITNCSSCSLTGVKTVCSTCISGNYPLSSGLTCQSCSSSIPNCASCYLSNNNLVCSSCINSTYTSSTGLSCQTCNQVIPNCSSCSTNNGNTICTSCAGAYTLNDNSCLSSPSNIPTNCASSYGNGCTSCNASQCLGCTSGTSLLSATSNAACQSCSSSISNCSSCSNNGGTLSCSSCTSGYYPTTNGLSCQTCSSIITGCSACSASNGMTICSSCSTGNYLSSNDLSCQPCSTIGAGCATCTNNSGTGVCSSCNSGYTFSSGSCSLVVTPPSPSLTGLLVGYLSTYYGSGYDYILMSDAARMGYNGLIMAFASLVSNNGQVTVNWYADMLLAYNSYNTISSCQSAVLNSFTADLQLAKSLGVQFVLASLGGASSTISITGSLNVNLTAQALVNFASLWGIDGYDLDIEVSVANPQVIASVIAAAKQLNPAIIFSAPPQMNSVASTTTGVAFVSTGTDQAFNAAIQANGFNYLWPQAYNTGSSSNQILYNGVLYDETMPGYIQAATKYFTGQLTAKPPVWPSSNTILIMGQPAQINAGGTATVWNNPSFSSPSDVFQALASNYSGTPGAMTWDIGWDVENDCQFAINIGPVFGITNIVCPTNGNTYHGTVNPNVC
jgi:chitinase